MCPNNLSTTVILTNALNRLDFQLCHCRSLENRPCPHCFLWICHCIQLIWNSDSGELLSKLKTDGSFYFESIGSSERRIYTKIRFCPILTAYAQSGRQTASDSPNRLSGSRDPLIAPPCTLCN